MPWHEEAASPGGAQGAAFRDPIFYVMNSVPNGLRLSFPPLDAIQPPLPELPQARPPVGARVRHPSSPPAILLLVAFHSLGAAQVFSGIAARGVCPGGTRSTEQGAAKARVETGGGLNPKNPGAQVVELAQACWAQCPASRPTMEACCARLEATLAAARARTRAEKGARAPGARTGGAAKA